MSWVENTGKRAEIRKRKPKPRPQKGDEGGLKVLNIRSSEVKNFRNQALHPLEEWSAYALEKLTKETMAGRGSTNKKERVTKNTILRTYRETPGGLDIGKENVADEA